MNPKDIVIGQARVCWGWSFVRGEMMESWHLPGGGTTNSRDIAESVCRNMAELIVAMENGKA